MPDDLSLFLSLHETSVPAERHALTEMLADGSRQAGVGALVAERPRVRTRFVIVAVVTT